MIDDVQLEGKKRATVWVAKNGRKKLKGLFDHFKSKKCHPLYKKSPKGIAIFIDKPNDPCKN